MAFLRLTRVNISDEALKDLWNRADQVIREMLVHFSPQFAACEADHLQDEKKCFRARRAKLRSLSGTPAECAFKNRDVLASPHGVCITTRRWQQMFGALVANKRVCPLRLLSAHSKHSQASINHSHAAINKTEVLSQVGHFSPLVAPDSFSEIFFVCLCVSFS